MSDQARLEERIRRLEQYINRASWQSAPVMVRNDTESFVAGRKLTAGTGISLTDGGAGGNLTVAAPTAHAAATVADTATLNMTLTGQEIKADVIPGGIDAADLASGIAADNYVLTADGLGGAAWETLPAADAPTDAQYVTLATNGVLSAERVLTAGTGISLTDSGAGGTLTVANTTSHAAATVADTATLNMTLTGQEIKADVIPGGIDAADLASGAAADNYVLTADGLGGAAWEAPAGGTQAFPVGSVFISVVVTNPNTLLGYGTWAAFGAGKVLVGLDATDTDFDTVEEPGGAKTVGSSAQTFAGNPLATHQHTAITAGTPTGTVAAIGATGTAAVKIGTAGATGAANSHTHGAPIFTGDALATHQHAAITAGTPSGSNTPGAATSVVQPYIVVYMWKRTA